MLAAEPQNLSSSCRRLRHLPILPEQAPEAARRGKPAPIPFNAFMFSSAIASGVAGGALSRALASGDASVEAEAME